jgi:hypothetical protein
MKLDELSTITGATIRQIRFLISEGFVPYPRGTHLRYIWGPTRPGDPALPAAEGPWFPQCRDPSVAGRARGVPVPVMDGLTLVIAPDLIGREASIDEIITRTEARLREAFTGRAPKTRKRAAG